jgi:Zn-finger protein
LWLLIYWIKEKEREKKNLCVWQNTTHFFYICFYCDRNCHLPKYFLYKCPQISKMVQYVPPTSVTDGRDIWNCKMPVWRAEPSNVEVLPRDNIVFSTQGRFWKINQFLLSFPMFMALVPFYLKVSLHFQCPLVSRYFLWSANNVFLDVA